LLQLRVVVTGIVFQILFSKRLTNIQWLSLILLTFGCIIKQIGHVRTQPLESTSTTNTSLFNYFNLSLVLILVQVFCSCFAGVYNEYLLKDSTNSAHIMIQNVFMYIDSIVCNLLILFLSGFFNISSTINLSNIFSSESIIQLFQFKVFLIMLNNALIGIVTSLFLKSLNSILKAFASALELMFTGVLSWLIFGIPLDANTIFAIFIVSFSTWLYSKNPVQNPAPSTTNQSRQNV
jgi:solute carrier family 35 (UDP-sugar transporter), member A1/2/3